MAELEPAEFDTFMREVTGFDPFPWQRRLLHVVLESGWPRLLDLPTGTGKTSTLLVALFSLAVVPERSARRIALIVDRRIIVDQVDGFVRQVDEALRDSRNPVSSKVAERLRALSAKKEAAPFRAVHLRGGIPRDDSWVGTPEQPTIIASTVDQVGSRLLFRGYGVSESMRPVHAGILGRDTLLLLDEVHLATAFEETLGRLEQTYAKWPEHQGTGRRLTVVRMSATPRDSDVPRFSLDEEDRCHPVLAKRLDVSRPAKLDVIKTKRATTAEVEAQNRATVAEAVCRKAREAANAGATAIGIVVNRVDTARRAAARLRADGRGRVLLLTGRMRPFDRSSIQEQLQQTVASGVERGDGAPPTFVVATSCIEAGADLDFDALVTEAASLDALRQRFGRLNRLGNYSRAPAWVLGRSDQIGEKAGDDPVYRGALRETWSYLNEVAREQVVDFGLSAFVEPGHERRAQLLPTPREAPVLFPSYLDAWSETRPAPYPDPDPALWLHGKEPIQERDINVVFRADIPLEVDEKAVADVNMIVEFLPPVTDEAVSVPRHELEAWFGSPRTLVWKWTAEGLTPTVVADLSIGDTIVVSAARGGLSDGTWDPTSSEPVEDVAELASFSTHNVLKLRIDRRTLPKQLTNHQLPAPTDSQDPDELDAARRDCLEWLDDRLFELIDSAPTSWQRLLRALSDAKPKARRVLTSDSVWRLTMVPPKRAVEATTEDEVSLFSGAHVSLESHLEDVAAWADAFARSAGLGADIASDVALAGLLHDLGKADVRFQALLQGGDPVRAAAAEPVAKSRQLGSASSRARAQERSGWPLGMRHELVSLALLDASSELQARANDLDLVRHLVASHHGWCRPWAPTTIDPTPMLVKFTVAGIEVEASTSSIDDEFLNECASRFRRLCRRYGWHGLAYLEALLRLGDHRASAEPGSRPGGER